MCISGRQPFPAGGRVTFNGKECVCEKCTQPVPVNSTASPQAVHSEYSVFLHGNLFHSMLVSFSYTHTLINFLNVCNDSFPCHFIYTTLLSGSLCRLLWLWKGV